MNLPMISILDFEVMSCCFVVHPSLDESIQEYEPAFVTDEGYFGPYES